MKSRGSNKRQKKTIQLHMTRSTAKQIRIHCNNGKKKNRRQKRSMKTEKENALHTNKKTRRELQHSLETALGTRNRGRNISSKPIGGTIDTYLTHLLPNSSDNLFQTLLLFIMIFFRAWVSVRACVYVCVYVCWGGERTLPTKGETYEEGQFRFWLAEHFGGGGNVNLWL